MASVQQDNRANHEHGNNENRLCRKVKEMANSIHKKFGEHNKNNHHSHPHTENKKKEKHQHGGANCLPKFGDLNKNKKKKKHEEGGIRNSSSSSDSDHDNVNPKKN